MRERWRRLAAIGVVVLAVGLGASAGWGQARPVPEVRENAEGLRLSNGDLQLHIAKHRAGNQPAGRPTSLRYRGRELLDPTNVGFGIIGLLSASDLKTVVYTIPEYLHATVARFPAEGKTVVILHAGHLVSSDGTQLFPITFDIEYTLYQDSNVIFMWITLDSSSKDWRTVWVTYGQSLQLVNCPNYEARGTANTVLDAGTLTEAPVQHPFMTTHPRFTAQDPKSKVAVTLFSLGLFPHYGTISGSTSSTRLSLVLQGARTYDLGWYEWGQYIRNLTYGTGLAVYALGEHPPIVTPWVMPENAPYGIIQSYDELPHDSYNVIQPNPTLAPETYNFWRWHGENPAGKVDLMLNLDYMFGDEPVTSDGIPGTWNVHGANWLVAASEEWKRWLVSSEGGWLWYGQHGYHHDYPWQWEFHGVTNPAWGTGTWDQIEADTQTLGLPPPVWYKAPGFNMQPEMLNVLIAHGIRGYNVNYEQPPRAVPWYFYRDDAGRSLILFSDGLSLDSDLSHGKTAEEIYDDLLAPGLRDQGLVALTGHFFDPSFYAPWKSILDHAEADFGIRYFLVEELIDYWQDVLLPLKYTYNSRGIAKNLEDPRLTFQLANSPIRPTTGTAVQTPGFTLWSPDAGS